MMLMFTKAIKVTHVVRGEIYVKWISQSQYKHSSKST